MKSTLQPLAALLCITLFAPALHAADASKPNIVFIYADDWGWGDLSCHGHPWLKTPNLDKLASEGIDFQQFNVLNPVCSPNRVAAMTVTLLRTGETIPFEYRDSSLQITVPEGMRTALPDMVKIDFCKGIFIP